MPTSPPDQPEPPRSTAADDPDAPGTPLRAILTGLAIDIGGSVVASILVGALYVLHVATSGLTDDQVKAALDQMPPQSAFAILAMVLGSLCSVAGGYACARIVQRDEFRVGGLMAIISAGLSLLSGGSSSDDMLTLLTACTVACNLLGVKYGVDANERRRARKAAQTGDVQQP